MMICGVKRDSRISATGPSRPRTGSNRPQLLCFAWFAEVGAVTGVGVSSRLLALERFFPLAVLPGTLAGAGRALTAVRRAAVRDVAYDI